MNEDRQGILGTFLDFRFRSFLTLKVLGVIYILGLVSISLGMIVFFFGGISQGGAETVLTLFFTPILLVLLLVAFRMYMESLALFFRLGEHTGEMRTYLAALAGARQRQSSSGVQQPVAGADPRQGYRAPQPGQPGQPG